MPVFLTMRRPGKPTRLLCLLGPFWPCLCLVTYPLILAVSLVSAMFFIPSAPPLVGVAWVCCTVVLLASLSLTACMDPGIVRRTEEHPEGLPDWRWSDQAQTFRPPRSVYDHDCGVVIEEFDHTCPWTGTGIGRFNMPCFSTFVGCVCICLVFNLLLFMGVFGDGAFGEEDDGQR
uniref:Palmitoyltransferase n=2 Tax=Rhizochromulina marina TaxID=1034831 RepID=A0A7S2WV94_9STRA|mmetsp:Transcript_8029/g.22790  ORF Transcript_8029/g.22790 Transcript_8029/m.22790 type:complete len:175 (+) Transcript_8029:199-723(+)